ncbi:MAG: long-chain fatty acid--CoA ligase [Candidatus Kapabacteria bacterium]|jgi:fatty-acyl-CoA synthase|nr:long-chain fatty acid--CoA ligase [Candidatus Kapabacteria bacterium]
MMRSGIEYDWFARQALYAPSSVALKEYESGRVLTYSALNDAASIAAMRLRAEFDVHLGDRVAVLADNSLEHIILLGAAQKLGFTLVPLNFRLAAAELDVVLADAAPRVVLVEDKYRAVLDAVPSAKVASAIVILREWFAQTPQPEQISAIDAHITPDLPLLLLYTSGTTGVPKGVMYSHQMLFWNSVNTGMSWDLTAQDCTVNCLPLFHTGGWNVLLTPLLHRGGMTVMMKKFDADAVLQLLEEERCTLFMGVPTVLQMLASSPRFAASDLSAIRYVVAGGEPMPLPLIETWQKRGIAVRQGYGMTEVGPNIFSLHHSDAMRKIGSIGRPNFYVQARLVDDNGNDVGVNEAGELLVRGPMVTPGYWQKPEATRDAFREGGWFCTGDVARRDEEGYYFITDRKKNMYISGGENVYPAEVERVLYAHEAVAEVAVIGVPDAQWGEVGKAFVVLKSALNLDSASVDAEAIRLYCRERLAAYKVPRYVEFLAELPKNDAGKINKRVLR